MGTWRTWVVALLALTWGCDGSIGAKQIAANGRSDDAGVPPIDPTGGGGTGGEGTGGVGGLGPAGPCETGPLSAPIANCNPTPIQDTGDPHADCVARINQYRAECQCLPPLDRWVEGEACTDGNAEYDSVNGFHASFDDQPCASGTRGQNECPDYGSDRDVIEGCLQVMWDEGPEDGDPNTVNGHYISMASTVFTRVACGFYTTPTGEVWGVQNFN
ncbi:MAG: hypothetical protein WBG86_22855 [Polyangiales bacterium]